MVSYSCRTDNTNTNFFYNRKTRLLSENESLFSKVLQCRSCGPGYRCILKRVCFYHMMSLFFVMLTSSLPQREKRVKGIVGKLTEMEPDTFFSSDSSGFFSFLLFPQCLIPVPISYCMPFHLYTGIDYDINELFSLLKSSNYIFKNKNYESKKLLAVWF